MKKLIVIAFLLFSSISYAPVFSQTTQIIVEYRIVTAYTITSLANAVNDLIRQGYQPFGSPFLTDGYCIHVGGLGVAQAMVRYK